jgi:hypothetical protein
MPIEGKMISGALSSDKLIPEFLHVAEFFSDLTQRVLHVWRGIFRDKEHKGFENPLQEYRGALGLFEDVEGGDDWLTLFIHNEGNQ